MGTERKDNRDLVIYFSAGAMAGVFSAGFAKVFAEAKLKKEVHAVYGNSAGSLTGLYFLSAQDELGARLYWEDLDGEKYIRWSRLKKYILFGFVNKLFRTSFETKPVFDIDYIEHLIRTKRQVDFKEFLKSKTDLYMIAYNLETSRHDYLHLQSEDEVIPFLRATGGGHPAYPHASLIHGSLYVDGGTIDDEHRIASIIERHPDKEIICVLNNPRWAGTRVRNFLNKFAIGLVMFPFFGYREARKTAKSDFSNLDVERLKERHPYLHFIANDLVGYQLSTNPEHHKMLYLRGQELAKEFLLSGELKNVKIKDDKVQSVEISI